MVSPNDAKGWVDDPRRWEQFADACRLSLGSDYAVSKFLLMMLYARPTSEFTNTDTKFLDGFLSVVKQIGYNIFLEVADACTARICQPLQPKVVPVAAKPDIVRMCTLLNRLQAGVLDTCNFLAEATSAWNDTYCCPCGFVFFETDEQTREIRCRRLDPLYTYWLRSEGRHPLHWGFDEFVSRPILCEQFPEHEGVIMSAPTDGPQNILGVDGPTTGEPGTVRVSRGWRRKTGDEPGKKVISINRTIVNGDGEGEEWPYDFFPAAVFRNRYDFRGYGGVPMGRYIAPHHVAINTLARTAEESFKGAIPVLLSHADSGVNENSDKVFHVRKWQGTIPPEVLAQNPVSEQLLRRIDYHDAKAYAIAGINKSLAAGQAPKGVVAAVAMREIVELADARAAEYQKHWEDGWRQAGHIIVALANELKKVHIRSSDANSEIMGELDTSAIKLEKNDYRINYSLASVLSKSLSGLLSDMVEIKDLGLIDTIDMAEAVSTKVPDLQGAVDRLTATRRLAAKIVQNAIEKGEIPIVPGPMMGQDGLDAVILLGKQAWCSSLIDPSRYPPENFEALRRVIRCAEAKKAPPQPTIQAVQPGQPVGQGQLVGVGTPAAKGAIARNQYEAMSMGLIPPTGPQGQQ